MTAELVRVSDENTLWSGSFDRPATELAAVQDSIIRAIGATLSVKAGMANGGASGAAGARGTADVEAYDLFLKGEFFRRRYEIQSAVSLLERAVVKDPAFARAHASLAMAYATLPLMGVTLPGAARGQASASIERAIALAPSLSAARVAQGMLQFTDFHFVEAEATLRKGIALDSADAEARVIHAFALFNLGRIDDALAEARIAVRLDPLSTDGLLSLGNAQMYQHQLRESLATFRNVLDIDPRSSIVYANLAEVYALLGQPDSAVAAAEAQLKIEPNAFGVRNLAMFAFASAGRWKDVDELRRQAIRDAGNSPSFVEAFSSVISGDLDAAMVATERGVRAREPWFNTIGLSCEPMFSPLRTRPRFVALVRELGATVCPPLEWWPIKPRP